MAKASQDYIRELQLTPNQEKLSAWIKDKEGILSNLPTYRGSKILAAPDLLHSFDPNKAPHHTNIITIDVGGTHLRFVSVHIVNGEKQIQHTTEEDISELCKTLLPNNTVHQFIEIISEKLIQLGIQNCTSLAVSWSFPFTAIKRTTLPVGIGAIISGTSKMQKTVPFLKPEMSKEVDGIRIDELLLSALTKRGITPQSIIFGNDTSFTALADDVDGALIASTGGNATCIEVIEHMGKTEIVRCNSEMGMFFLLEKDLLGIAEQEWAEQYKNDTGIYPSFETIMCGRMLPLYFRANVHYLLTHHPALSTAMTHEWILTSDEINEASLITKLENLDFNTLATLFPQTNKLLLEQPQLKEILIEVSSVLLSRAGNFAGIMAYLSIYPLLALKQSVKVAVDSSLAAASKAYKSSLETSFQTLTQGHGELIFIRSDALSAPTIGAIHAASSSE